MNMLAMNMLAGSAPAYLSSPAGWQRARPSAQALDAAGSGGGGDDGGGGAAAAAAAAAAAGGEVLAWLRGGELYAPELAPQVIANPGGQQPLSLVCPLLSGPVCLPRI
jgi:hypothetical protein